VIKHFSRELTTAVLDTQTVLDWLFFRDPVCATWPWPGRDWQWLASASMRDELAHVLERGFPEKWTVPKEHVITCFDRYALLRAVEPPSVPLSRALRCSDPDDQQFIDLAVGVGARWLVSRDRAVLKLRRAAWTLAGVHIVRPNEWTPGGWPPGERPLGWA
jgi:predicted nucleic acid-binding protein